MGQWSEKALSLPEENKAIKENIRILGSSLWITRLALNRITTVWNRSDKYSSIIRSGGLRTRRFAGTFTDISAAMVFAAEGKYKLEIQYVWARCMERSCDRLLWAHDQNEWWSLGTCTKSRHEYHGSHKHESERYYTGDCQVPHQQKCRYIDLRSKDAIYSTPGVCEQKPIKVWISDVLEKHSRTCNGLRQQIRMWSWIGWHNQRILDSSN
jgi:hypothetical protein